MGQTSGEAIVIENLEEVKKLDFSKNIRLYSQTTKSLDGFKEIVEYIKEHISPEASFEFYDSICRQVANRMPHIRTFAASHAQEAVTSYITNGLFPVLMIVKSFVTGLFLGIIPKS